MIRLNSSRESCGGSGMVGLIDTYYVPLTEIVYKEPTLSRPFLIGFKLA